MLEPSKTTHIEGITIWRNQVCPAELFRDQHLEAGVTKEKKKRERERGKKEGKERRGKSKS